MSPSTISSGSKIRMPLRAPTRSLSVRPGADCSRQLVRIAIRPPGVSTRVMWSSAAIGIGEEVSAAKQQTASKLASRKGSASASPRT